MTSSFRTCAFALAILPRLLLLAAEPAKKPAPAAAPAPAPASAESPAAAAEDAAAPAAAAEEAAPKAPSDFERYKTIIDRKPFGREPPNFNPDAPAGSAAAAAAGAEGEAVVNVSEEEQRIISAVRVSVLNVTPRGKVAVGFTDSSKSPAANYYLMEGESRDGWTFVSANVAEKTVVLSQNGVEATIPLGGGAPEAGGRKGGLARPNLAGRPAAAPAPMPGRRDPAPAAEAESAGGGAFAHLRARRARKEADQKAEAEAQAAAAEQAKADREAAAAEREQQRAALLQIQEELRRQREERQQRAAEAENAGQDANGEQPVQE